MNVFRRPQLLAATRILLALLMLMLAGRSEANSFPLAPDAVAQSQMMADCDGMASDLAGLQHPSPVHQPDQGQAGICHLGCPVLLAAGDAKN